MVKDFEGKNEWGIILGGSSGLGLATARKLAKHGLNLCIVYRARRSDREAIESEFESITKQNQIELIHFNLDAVKVENQETVLKSLQERLGKEGRVKVLVHSIAKGNLKPMVSIEDREMQIDDLHLTLDNMAFSLYTWTKLILKATLFAKDARIISFTSEGNSKAWKNYAAVSAAKASLEAITRNMALELAPLGIRSNCLQAGVTDTTSFRMIPGSEKLSEASLKRNPFHRLTVPEDVANVVYLLCKDEASWINGAVIPVNGGEHLS